MIVVWLGPGDLASACWNCRKRLCRERQHRSRALHERVSEMGLALNSLFVMEVLPAALGTSRAHEKARRVPHRSAMNLSIEIFPLNARRVPPQEALRELLRVSAFTAMAAALRPCRAKLLVLPDSSVQDTTVQDFARLGNSDILVVFKEKLLIGSVGFFFVQENECEVFFRRWLSLHSRPQFNVWLSNFT